MLSKETFVKTLDFIKDLGIKQCNFVKALESLSPITYCDAFIYDGVIDFLVNMLIEELNDINADIEYFLFEMNYVDDNSFDAALCPKYSDGTILYNSPETLYNYLINKKD